MMLKNKNTGEIISIDIIKNRDDGGWVWNERESLKSLNEDWEDYKPVEPLIKDEKIRKAVRAWAEVNDIERAQYSYDGNCLWYGDNEIDFKYLEPLALALNAYYTIEELCGEEG